VDVSRPLTVDELERWESFGARWRLVEISDRRAVVDLCQCTGELVEQRGASDPLVLDYLRRHLPADASL
jgi:hypothetical protein